MNGQPRRPTLEHFSGDSAHPPARNGRNGRCVQNTCKINVGRLLEIRVRAGYRTLDEIEQLAKEIDSACRTLQPNQRPVAVTDWRACPPLSDEISTVLLKRLGRDAPPTCASIVAPDSPPAVLKLLEDVGGHHPCTRRCFYDVPELLAWLYPFLTRSEYRRLQVFVKE